jgi:hypothetical protein
MKTSSFIKTLTVAFTMGISPVFAQQAVGVQITATNPTCYGYTNGEIVVTITGGTMPFSLNGAPLKGSQLVLSNLSAGNYDYVVQDANGNTVTGFAQLTQPQALAFSSVVTNVSFNGTNNGAIDLTVPNVPLTFEWQNYGGTTPVNGQEDQTGLAVGSYKVIITQGNGCITSQRFEVEQNVQNPFLTSGYIANTQFNTTSSAMTVFPNPSNGHINLRSNVETKSAMIMNDMGVIVHQTKDAIEGTIQEVDLLPGVYTLMTTDKLGNPSTERIVIR